MRVRSGKSVARPSITIDADHRLTLLRCGRLRLLGTLLVSQIAVIVRLLLPVQLIARSAIATVNP